MDKNLTGALIGSVALMLFFVFVMPEYSKLSSARDALKEREIILADSRSAIANINALSSQYVENQSNINRILLALPKSRQFDYLTSSIHNASSLSGTQLVSVTIAEPKKSDDNDYKTIPVSLKMVGTFNQFMDFISKLESSLRVYDVTSVNFVTSGSDGLSNTLIVTLEISTYSLD